MPCRAPYRWLMALLLATYALISGPALAADSTETKAKQIWQLLDYVAVDYGGAVANGTVLKASEYAEMQEFVATAERQLGELPSKTDKARLLQQATELRRAVANKADPAIVAQLAHALSSAVQKRIHSRWPQPPYRTGAGCAVVSGAMRGLSWHARAR